METKVCVQGTESDAKCMVGVLGVRYERNNTLPNYEGESLIAKPEKG